MSNSVDLGGWSQAYNVHGVSDLELISHLFECEDKSRQAAANLEKASETSLTEDIGLDAVIKWAEAFEMDVIASNRLSVARFEMRRRTLYSEK